MEIARVVLRSVLMDVFSLRAKWNGRRYHYRFVDEYGGAYVLPRKTSTRPLTLRQVIHVLENGDQPDWSIRGQGLVATWWDQQWRNGDDPETCTDFAWVESDIYSDLAPWYETAAEAWRAEREQDDALGLPRPAWPYPGGRGSADDQSTEGA